MTYKPVRLIDGIASAFAEIGHADAIRRGWLTDFRACAVTYEAMRAIASVFVNRSERYDFSA